MFSLIIPAYNRGNLIAETLESALNQTTPFSEIIVVDDGSTDDTPEVLQRYAARVRTIRTKNQGVQKARNTGVDAAQHERVVFCDSDDLLDPDYLQVVSMWLKAHSHIDVTYCNFSTFGARPWYSDRYFSAPKDYFNGGTIDDGFYVKIPDLYIRSIRYPTMWVTGMSVKRDFYIKIGGFDTSLNKIVTEDWEFNLRAIDNGSIALCRRPLARVRYHAGNQSGDSLKLAMGAVHILEYSLTKHKEAHRYNHEIKNKISEFTAMAFTTAFAIGQLDTALKIIESPYFKDKSRNIKIKIKILQLPTALRYAFWYTSKSFASIFSRKYSNNKSA